MSKKRIKELEINILKARQDYYNNNPTVSDQVYDAWVDELAKIDPDNKAVTAIGAPAVSSWPKVKHLIRMGSLNKVNTADELEKWYVNDCGGKGTVLVTEKLDGISISLRYENGLFSQAVTRGDGSVGEDITPNVKKMKGVKLKIDKNFTGHVRGEIILCKSDHQKYFSSYSNSRNAASGIAKRYDGEGAEHLTVMCYTVDGKDFKDEFDAFAWLETQGFETPSYEIKTLNLAIKVYNQYQDKKREALDYDIDGLVVRLNNLAEQEALGEKNHRPKGAIAFKFEAASVEAKLLDIKWQVGNSGRITPVAILEPVSLMGVTIKRASLHNAKKVESLKLFKGCRVIVSRRNDVIPYIEENLDA